MTLPGYEQKAESVYVKQEVVQTNHGDMTLQRVVLLGKYTMPTEQGVIDYLRSIVDKVSVRRSLTLPPGLEMVGSGLEKAVLELPNQFHQDFRIGKEDLFSYIRANTSALSDDADARSYVQVHSELLPPEVIPDIEHKGRKGYESVLHHPHLQKRGLGLQWSGKVLLSDGVLPLRTEMDVLLKHGVRHSRTLAVEGKFLSEDVTSLIQGLYEIEKQNPLFSALFDLSTQMRELYTLEPVMALRTLFNERDEMDAALQQRAAGSQGGRLVSIGVPGNGAGSPLMPGTSRR
ncbi:hypothetical protein A2642_02980 [Candidatus Nomurabacteria bacterium RIFCSPHIGHO2_01_FULL_39_10]|uniref:Uncharacterized protein n=1 Tax=Candidatus Nomurabacteria bacterium RIFCSPHIGHO2_01_FULL_39_10 TaxID=1801733 RepID=A0A1F6V4M6_9BACT|nr:MAG: hypothetical protein A2642_02980 [Candidatus Nomurabacteria bacterium RIFCSPHIGHO2_01_FULL_39_10]